MRYCGRYQRRYSQIPCSRQLGWRNYNNCICKHSSNLNLSCEFWSDEVWSLNRHCRISYWDWCYWRIVVCWKLLVQAGACTWISTTINWVTEWYSYLLWFNTFAVSLTNHLTILSNINLLANSCTSLIDQI